MTALYIIGGILLFFLFLLLCPIKIRLSYCQNFKAELQYLFFKFSVFDSSEKKKHKKKAKKEEKAEVSPKKEEKAKRKKLKDIQVKELLSVIKETISALYKKFSKHLYLKKAVLKISVASDDPAKTGVLYGGVCAAAAPLHTLLSSIKHRSRKEKTIDFTVEPDFLAEKTDVYADITLSLKLLFVLSVASTGGLALMKIKDMVYEDEEKQEDNDKNTAMSENRQERKSTDE